MTFFKPKPGESLVIETPNGPVVIKMFSGEQVGIEVPAGMEVKASKAEESWLPARPNFSRRKLA